MSKLTNKNIVLDLDSTMVHTSSDLNDYNRIHNNSNHRIKYFELNSRYQNDRKMWTVLRPYTVEFLYFCTKYFKKIIIFTAGHNDYAHKIRQILEQSLGDRFADVVYSCEYCLMPDRKTVHKPLSIFTQNPNLKDVTEFNTFALDDREDTFAYNPQNGILIPPYEPELHELDYDDHALLQLMGWLSLPEVVNTQDVRILDKSNIFDIPIEHYTNKVNEYLSL